MLGEELLGVGFSVMDVHGDTEPVEDFSRFVANGACSEPPPADGCVCGADHASFDLVFDAGIDGTCPCIEDGIPVCLEEGVEPDEVVAGCFHGEAHVVEEALIGVCDSAFRGSHPDGLRVEVGEDAVAFFAGGECFFVLLSVGDVAGDSADVGGYAGGVVDGCAIAFDPAGVSVGGDDSVVDGDDLSGVDGLLGGFSDAWQVFGEDDLLPLVDGGDECAGASEDGVGAVVEGHGAGGEIDLPGGDGGGLLDEGEGGLLLEEGLFVAALGGDVAEEDDDAVVGGPALNVEPEVEWLGIEVFELAGDAVLHGAGEEGEELAGLGGGELFPEVSADEVSFDGKEFAGAAIEEGEGPVAGYADDGVGSGLEDLFELAGGGVAPGLGFFSGGDVAGEDDDSIFVGADGDLEPDIEGFWVVGLKLGGDAAIHGGAVVGGEGLVLVEGEAGPEVFADELVGFEDEVGGTVGEGAVPVSIDADDGVGGGFEDLDEVVEGFRWRGAFGGRMVGRAFGTLGRVRGWGRCERRDGWIVHKLGCARCPQCTE